VRPEDAISSRWLVVFIFALVLASGAWIGTAGRFPLVSLCVVAIGLLAVAGEFPLPLSAGERPRLRATDWLLTTVAIAPLVVNLMATWSQEFPHGGDQVYHNGAGLEAYAFWWWLPWFAAVAGLILVLRFPFLALPMLIGLMAAAVFTRQPLAFAGRYPAVLHFLSVPLHAFPFRSPLNVTRLINALSVPGWLLVLRPGILRRRVDPGSFAAALFLFWQKDVVYYFTSGYLEPWAIVLLLTAAEHLVRFGPEMIWRPLLLIGGAAMVKEQMILSLPVVALMYFPFRESWRQRFRYGIVVAAAIAPTLMFLVARRSFRTWQPAYPTLSAFSASHVEAVVHRVQVEFGASLPVVVIALMAMLVLALRRRAFAALFLASLVTWLVFFTASVLQEWPGYPRGNLVPLAYAAVALGSVIESLASRSRVAAGVALASIAALNGIVLAPFLRDTLRPDSARNFIEHSDAAIFYPIRESIQRAEAAGFVSSGATIVLLNNGKWTYPHFYPGPVREQYPDLSSRYRLLVKSFAFAQNWQRCRCSSGETTIALFIRVQNLGGLNPALETIEREARQCRQEMMGTCRRMMPIEHEGVLTGFVGSM